MSIGYYDEALMNKFNNWIPTTSKLHILKPDETRRIFGIKASENKDKVTLPIIALSRDKDIDILENKKQPKTFNGYKIISDKDINVPLNVIPIELKYQLDIYTKGIAEADEYLRNFIAQLINYPKVKVKVKHSNIEIETICNIELEKRISDNSDIPEKLFPDQFQRYTIRFTLKDVYLFSLPKEENSYLDIEESSLKVKDRTSGDIVEEDKII